MNSVRSDAHAVAVPDTGQLYIVGGFDGQSCFATAERYDPRADRWTLIGRLMRSQRSGVGM